MPKIEKALRRDHQRNKQYAYGLTDNRNYIRLHTEIRDKKAREAIRKLKDAEVR